MVKNQKMCQWIALQHLMFRQIYQTFALLCCSAIEFYPTSWDRNYDHIHQRLMEAVASGLHSSAPSVLSILQKALDSFHSYTFVPLPGILPFFTQLCQRLPTDLQTELFPKLITDHVSSISFFCLYPLFHMLLQRQSFPLNSPEFFFTSLAHLFLFCSRLTSFLESRVSINTAQSIFRITLFQIYY